MTTVTQPATENGTAPTTPRARDVYRYHLSQPSDIQHHLPLLYSLARGNVVELGTRTGVSTSALLAGVEARGGTVTSIDIDHACAHVAEGHPQWSFVRGGSTDETIFARVMRRIGERSDNTALQQIDLLLIDTEHTVSQVTDELTLWSDAMRPGSTICIHDPETFPGVRRAVLDFCTAKGWPVTFVLPCNGMAVIEVPGE